MGAGCSTEAPGVLPNTFYEDISYRIGNNDLKRPFPDVMEEYCRGPRGRTELIRRIKSRFDAIYAQPAIYSDATRFHRELSTFFPITTIVTTNWDTYFEDECGAVAFVEDKDIALWEAASRKVLKVHGTISNFGSLVATRSDYKRCASRLKSGIVGALLKSTLATQCIVFIGYSLTDEDFLQVYDAVRRSLGDFHRRAYFVSPIISDTDKVRLSGLNLHLIETDGQFFIRQLKQHAWSYRCICPDEMYENVYDLSAELTIAHDWLQSSFDMFDFPQTLVSSWYQDGMKHALDRILRSRKTGAYSDAHTLISIAHSYFYFARRYLQDRIYDDAAYCEGYANGYLYASHAYGKKADVTPPLFYHFGGFQTSSGRVYQRMIKKLPTLHKAAHKKLSARVAGLTREKDLMIHHKAQLNLRKYIDELPARSRPADIG